MEPRRSVTAQVKSRGQLTIPKKIRLDSHLEEGQVVTLIPIGDSLILTPKRLELDEARRQLRRIVKMSGIPLEELLRDLAEERGKLYRETYGRKTR